MISCDFKITLERETLHRLWRTPPRLPSLNSCNSLNSSDSFSLDLFLFVFVPAGLISIGLLPVGFALCR
jgi:hypothetical protein